MRGHRLAIFAAMVAAFVAQNAFGGVADDYLAAYLRMFPTRATQAGDHAFDQKLEDFSSEQCIARQADAMLAGLECLKSRGLSAETLRDR